MNEVSNTKTQRVKVKRCLKRMLWTSKGLASIVEYLYNFQNKILCKRPICMISNRSRSLWKVTKYDPLYLLSIKKTGGQQECKHRWVQHVQGEHYQRNVLEVFALLSGPVVNPESSSLHRRSPKSINQSQNSKIPGLSLLTRSLVFTYLRLHFPSLSISPDCSMFLVSVGITALQWSKDFINCFFIHTSVHYLENEQNDFI